jgi:calcineurin-like phosphoesterase family protein
MTNAERNKQIMLRVKEHYGEVQALGYNVAFIALQGSQNYEMDLYTDEYMSDIDTKVIVIPTLKDIVSGKPPVSTTLVRENNEHIDIKDIRLMADMWKKQNPSYLELLFTKYKILNPLYKDITSVLFENAEQIAKINSIAFYKAIKGMAYEKQKALCHPYPNTMDKINKFGYDPKQLHHIARLHEFTLAYIETGNYAQCMVPYNKDHLLRLKLGALTLGIAQYQADTLVASLALICDEQTTNHATFNDEAKALVDKAVAQYIEVSIRNELKPVEQPAIKIGSQAWAISDTHFYHRNMIKLEDRPFSNIDAMNNGLIYNWNDYIKPDDTVYILGDFAMTNGPAVNKLLAELNGHKHLIVGNHDADFLNDKRFDRTLFESIQSYLEVSYKSKVFIMCHYPLVTWNKEQSGSIHLYGHVHSNMHHSFVITELKPNMYNVGVDTNNFLPVSLDKLVHLAERGALTGREYVDTAMRKAGYTHE